VHVTREDANAYANWIGGRLPTEAEWEYAARAGLDGQIYGWDDAETLALSERANTWQGIFPIANTATDGYDGIAPVGSYPPNAYGLYDMIGNVWEWTDEPYFSTHDYESEPALRKNGFDPSQPGIAVGVIKGGSFLCARNYCYRFRPAARQAQDLAFGTSHIGFRVVRD
jgi:formylglycine-generating enzyme required for sulfatase activity